MVLHLHPNGTSPPETDRLELSTGHETFIKLSQIDLKTLNTDSRPCELNKTQIVYRDFYGKEDLKYHPSIDDCYKVILYSY